MIVRNRLIITALLLCHSFLCPVLLTSEARSFDQQQTTAPAATSVTSANPDTAQPAAPATPQGSKKSSGITATDENGQEDAITEDILDELLQTEDDQQLGPPRPAMNIPLGRNEVLIRADEQEKNQDIYNVRGHVVIRFGTYTLHSDQATYDSTTGVVKANGHVVFDGGPRNEHITGSRASYEVSRDSGTFYDATGSIGARLKNRMMFLTSSTPFFFTGKVVEKLGPDRYRVNDGYVTSCELPKPKWKLVSKKASVEVGNDAVMHDATLRLGGIPVFYFPVVEHPVDNLGRKSGFLIPSIGQSTLRGTVFGDSFYWAMARNADATLGAALYSARGWAQFGNLRAIGYTYTLQANYYGVVDEEGAPVTHQNQGGEDIRVNGTKQLPHGFIGSLSVDYLSSFLFRQVFALQFSEAIESEVRSSGFVYKNWNGYAFGILGSSYQDYQNSTPPGDDVQIVHSPSLDFSTAERPFNNFVYAYDVSAGGLSRNEPGFETAPFVGRADVAPYVAWPKLFKGWTLRPEIGARETYWSERLVPGPSTTVIGTAVHDPINRNVANASFDLRPPTLSRIFDHKPFGRVLKHTIEPFATYRYQTGIDDFSQILRFDSRDILADTNEVEYGITNRLFAKKTELTVSCFQHPEYTKYSENMSEGQNETGGFGICDDKTKPAREVLSWTIAQKYFANPTFGGALVPGQRNVFDTTEDLTGIAFLTEPRNLSPIVSRLRASSGNADVQWDLDYDPVLHQINDTTEFVGYRFGNWYTNAGHAYVNAPGELSVINGATVPNVFDQWRLGVVYGAMTKKGLSGGMSVAVDSQMNLLQAVQVQTNYTWDCCGLTFQYVRWEYSTASRETAFRFALSLTNFGTFGSISRPERLY